MIKAIIEIVKNISKLLAYFFNPKERKIRRKEKFTKELEKLERRRDEALRKGDDIALSECGLAIYRLRQKAANYK